ncbi:glycosyltransferase [Chitinophaga sp.]|uniref:glycosyltransferase n=1 Tax=Chitinophaga sp. TaxID=1869181 RepID=UPI002F941708
MVEKIIHQIVGPKTTELIDHCLNSWLPLKEHGFEIKVWSFEDINNFVETIYPFALSTLLNARNLAESADIARYLIVHHHGGYYMDWDIELIDPEGFLKICQNYGYGYLVVDPFNGTLASECFSAAREEAYLLSLVEDVVELFNNGLQDTLTTPKYSGPYRMRDSLIRHDNSRQDLIEVNSIFLYNYREIREMPERETVAPLIHYWAHMWLRPAFK